MCLKSIDLDNKKVQKNQLLSENMSFIVIFIS